MRATILAAVLALGGAIGANAATVFSATGSASNATNAFNDWAAAVGAGNFTTDGTDGATGRSGAGGAFTTALGNRFSIAGDDDLRWSNTTSTIGVITGPRFSVGRRGAGATLTWHIVSPAVDSFGFNAYDNDRGTIRVSFNDGTSQSFTMTSGSSGDNNFWGIQGLASPISSVSIFFTDPGGGSLWDNFSYGNSTPAVPLPASALLLLGGIAGMGVMRRKKAKA